MCSKYIHMFYICNTCAEYTYVLHMQLYICNRYVQDIHMYYTSCATHVLHVLQVYELHVKYAYQQYTCITFGRVAAMATARAAEVSAASYVAEVISWSPWSYLSQHEFSWHQSDSQTSNWAAYQIVLHHSFYPSALQACGLLRSSTYVCLSVCPSQKSDMLHNYVLGMSKAY